MKKIFITIVFALLLTNFAKAQDKLILEMEMEEGLLYLNHHIENFLFDKTKTTSTYMAGDLSARMAIDPLKGYLIATGLISMNGEVVGIATEQEIVYTDEMGRPTAKSSWLVSLNHPEMNGVFAVEQTEDSTLVFEAVSAVMQNPQKEWPDTFHRFLSTSSDAKISMATEGLPGFKGAKFREFNYINQADMKNFGRFRAKIQFEITKNK